MTGAGLRAPGPAGRRRLRRSDHRLVSTVLRIRWPEHTADGGVPLSGLARDTVQWLEPDTGRYSVLAADHGIGW